MEVCSGNVAPAGAHNVQTLSTTTTRQGVQARLVTYALEVPVPMADGKATLVGGERNIGDGLLVALQLPTPCTLLLGGHVYGHGSRISMELSSSSMCPLHAQCWGCRACCEPLPSQAPEAFQRQIYGRGTACTVASRLFGALGHSVSRNTVSTLRVGSIALQSDDIHFSGTMPLVASYLGVWKEPA